MHENIWRRVTFLVNLLLCRLDKFDGSIFGGGGGVGAGAYILDVNWVTYLGGVYSGGLYTGRRINGILRHEIKTNTCSVTLAGNCIVKNVYIFLLINN